MGDHDHHTNHCKIIKCVSCGGGHISRSNECGTWKKENELMRLKVTQNLTYLEARKQIEQTPLFNFSQVVKYFASKPETKTTATQYSDEDYKITERSKVLIAIKPNKTIRPQNQKSTSDQANANAKQINLINRVQTQN